MLFASFPYLLLFLPLVLLLAIAARHFLGPKSAQFLILAASLIFYSHNLIFLAATILLNWLLARRLTKTLLLFGITANIATLCAFKYLFPAHSPLGLSFITLMQIMYLVDCHEGALTPGGLFDHATFTTFFPYVLSGPLARPTRIRPQLQHFGGAQGERTANISRGLFLFALGLFKKVVFAGAFARVATYGRTYAFNLSALEAWIYALAFALQLFFDFSGYSDMAIGSARMLGIEIPRNFDRPFRALSILEFWQRWHISLTQFLTSYLYTPLVRVLRTPNHSLIPSILATVLTMTIAGLWHGATWTFLVFGLLHGFYLTVNHLWHRRNLPQLPAFAAWLLTFTCVLIALIYFSADTVAQATHQTLTLFNPRGALGHLNLGEMIVEGISMRVFFLPLLGGLLAAFLGPSSEQLARNFRPTVFNSLATVALLATAFVFLNSTIPAPFLYFRF